MTSLNIRTLVGYGSPAASLKNPRKIPVGEEKSLQKYYNISCKKSCEASCTWALLLDKKEKIYYLTTNYLAEDLTTCAGTGVGPSSPGT
jgi:hypothetical protein